MSDQLPSNKDADLSPTSSWEVISETDISRSNSIENISVEDCDEIILESTSLPPENPTISSLENEFQAENGIRNKINPPESAEINSSKNEKKTKNKPKKRKRDTDIFATLSILASLFTITGLTILFCLLPTETNKTTLGKTQTNYINLLKENTKTVQEKFYNNTENFNNFYRDKYKTRDTDNFEEECYLNEGVCLMNNKPDDFFYTPTSEIPSIDTANKATSYDAFYDKYLFTDIQNTTASLFDSLRGVCTNPSLHVFLCTLMQDVCLVKLVNQLEKRQNLYEKLTQSLAKKVEKKVKHKATKDLKPQSQKTKSTKKGKNDSSIIKQKQTAGYANVTKPPTSSDNLSTNSTIPLLESKSSTVFSFFPKTKSTLNQDLDQTESEKTTKLIPTSESNSDKNKYEENGKSECERRFEELEIKWKSVGKNHLQKMKEIKQKFRSELNHLHENEKESRRKHKIQLLRENYIEKLKVDREKYLMELRKIKDERQKTMKEICNQKNVAVNEPKDAAVGNSTSKYSVNIQERLTTIQNPDVQIPKLKKRVSPTNFPLKDYTNFWKSLSKSSPSEDSVKKRLKKKNLRKTKLGKPAEDTVVFRTLDSRTQIALIEEIVKNVLSKLSTNNFKSHEIQNDSFQIEQNRVKENLEEAENNTLVSTFSPESSVSNSSLSFTFANPIPASVSKITVKSNPSKMSRRAASLHYKPYDLNKTTVSLPPITDQLSNLRTEINNSDIPTAFSKSNESVCPPTPLEAPKETNKSSEAIDPHTKYLQFGPFLPDSFTPETKKSTPSNSLSSKNSSLSNSLISEAVAFKWNDNSNFISVERNQKDVSENKQSLIDLEGTCPYNTKNKQTLIDLEGTCPYNTSATKPLPLKQLLKKSKHSTSIGSKSETCASPNHVSIYPNESSLQCPVEFDFMSSPARYKNKEELNGDDEIIENELKLIVRDTPDRNDIYNIVFDENGEKIRQNETSKKQHLQKYPTLSHIQIVRKQSPKVPKKVYLFKGRL